MSVADRIAALTPEQRALFEAMRQKTQRKPVSLQPPPVPRRGAGEHWPLSFDQERLWFLYLLDPRSTAYNIDTACRIRGRFDAAVLGRAFQEVPRRHEAWRTRFPAVDGRPVQVIEPEMELPSALIDLSALPAARREKVADGLMREEAREPFNLETGPLVRAKLLRVAEDDHFCLVTVHHIVTDWVSFHIFWREVGVLYDAFLAGRPSPLPELPAQYADFALWQREWMQGEVLETLRDHWTGVLAGAPLLLDLPTDRPRPAVQTTRGDRVQVGVGPAHTAALRAVARREGATLFMVFLALYQALLGRHSGQDRVIVGTANANRNRPEIEPLLGFFLTQLPFCTDVSGDPTLRELVRRARRVALDAYAHQELPFGKLVEALHPGRDLAVAPIVQTILLLLDGNPEQTLSSLHSTPIDLNDGNARYDHMFALWDEGDRCNGNLEYNRDLWDATTLLRFVEELNLLVEGLAQDPDLRLSQVPVFTPGRRHQVLAEWNDTALVATPGPVSRRFEARVRRSPDRAALVLEGRVVSAGELNRRANRLARRLRRLGVGPEVMVGIFLERTPQIVVALLAVQKAGGAYLPLEPAYPPERNAWMLDDCGAALVITEESLAAALPAMGGGGGALPLVLEWEAGKIAAESGEDLATAPGPGDRAYVIYTSGSTGRPKGVDITHRGLAQFLAAFERACPLDTDDVVAAITTIAFDPSVVDLYLSLVRGATVALLSAETRGDARQLALALDEHEATLLQATPATWRQLLDGGWRGRRGLRLLTGAEALTRDLASRLLPLGAGLWNLYGPTETTVWATVAPVAPAAPEERPPDIGRPIGGLSAHLVDRDLRPVALGARGELVIGGASLARGYFRRPDLSAERFLPDPLAGERGEAGARLYRTGDLARYLPDGRLEYLGRLDHQVKVRGFRIELGEIEAALRRHPAVAEAAVLRREEREGDARLVAYLALVANGAGEETPLEAAELRAMLRRELPDYMVPSAFVTLSALPRNANRKVDRRALAQIRPEASSPAEGEADAAPLSPGQEALAAIWREVLGCHRVGAHDDFFLLGGHSLLATQMVIRVREAFGVELPVREVFRAPTLAALDEEIQSARRRLAGEAAGALLEGVVGAEGGIPAPPIQVLPREETPFAAPLSFAQERLWFLDQLEPGGSLYNLPVALAARGTFSPALLDAILSEVTRRHETLRTTFGQRDGAPVQLVARPPSLRLPLIDLSGLQDSSGTEREAEARRIVAAEAARPFDLARGPLLRGAVVRFDATEHVVVLTLHHIVSDAWSTGVLVREVSALYAALAGAPSGSSGANGTDGVPAASPVGVLPPLPVQYADFAAWQRGWLGGEVLAREIDHWREQLAGAPALLALPTDRPRPPVQSYRGALVHHRLGAGLTAALRALAREHEATLFMVLLAGFQLLLARLSGQREVMVGTPIAGRTHRELEGLIGFFVNTLVLRGGLEEQGEGESGRELVERARETALSAYGHQEVPFEKLVEELAPERSLAHAPLFQVLLALQNVPREELRLPGLVLSGLPVEGRTAKFDLSLYVVESGEELLAALEHRVDLFDRVTVERLLGQLELLLGALAAAPAAPAAELPLLGEAEAHQVLREWNDVALRQVPSPASSPHRAAGRLFEEQVTPRPPAGAVLPPGTDVSERLAAQAALTPEAMALFWPRSGAAFTYRELQTESVRLARRLRALAVGPEVVVGVFLDRCPALVLALAAVLEAGGAYLPLDPSHPAERTAFTLEDSGAVLVLTRAGLAGLLPATLGAGGVPLPVLVLDREAALEPRLTASRKAEPLAGSPARAAASPVQPAQVAAVSVGALWQPGEGLAARWLEAPAPGRRDGSRESAGDQEGRGGHDEGSLQKAQERAAGGWEEEPGPPPAVRPGPANLSHVIYTSGSTGRPKGVAVTRGGVAAFLDWSSTTFTAEELAGVLAATSVGFDVSIFEIFGPLVSGGTVVLAENVLDLLEWRATNAFSAAGASGAGGGFGSSRTGEGAVASAGDGRSEGGGAGQAGRPAVDAGRPRWPALTLVGGVPSAFAEVVRAGRLPPSVVTVNLAGEPLPAVVAAAVLAQPRVRRVLNLYGPTEDTTFSTVATVTAGEPVPAIGRPLAGGRAYLLDDLLQPVAPGGSGEIVLGGSGLARGYLGRSDLTAERFVPDPFAGTGVPPAPVGGRLYRTGDLGRWLPDGRLAFLGRRDGQVKVRGFRVELGEVEAALATHPQVREAAVLLGPAGDRLEAHLVTGAGSAGGDPTGIAVAELAAFLRRVLPEHMVPASYAFHPALPRTGSGKIDRRSLATPEGRGTGSGEPRPGTAEDLAVELPRTPIEELIAGVWREVLDRPAVGRRASFFALGGHSLLATRAASRLRLLLGVELPVKALFEAPTVADLAGVVEGLQRQQRAAASEASRAFPLLLPPVRRRGAPASPAPGLPPHPADGLRGEGELSAAPELALDPPVSFAQERLWVLDRLEPGSTSYNLPMALRLEGDLDDAALERALTEVVRRHETLRTTFSEAGGFPRQHIGAVPEGGPLRRIDLTALGPRAEAEALRLVAADAAEPFDLARGPLFRPRLVSLSARERLLLASMHHIISDAWSLTVLVREVVVCYRAFLGARAAGGDEGALEAGRPRPGASGGSRGGGGAGELPPAALPELPVQYADFAVWQRGWLSGAVLEAEIGYWRQRLAGAPAALELPTDRPRPAVRSLRGTSLDFVLPAALGERLAELSRQVGATPFMVLVAGLAVLCTRASGQDELVLGTPIANRRTAEFEDLIGMFVNTLALRIELRDGPSFAALLARVRGEALEAYAHQDAPFEKLVEELRPRRDTARNPIFQILLALQNVPLPAGGLPGVTLSAVEARAPATKTDLAVYLHPRAEGGFRGNVEYATDLFDRTTILRFVAHFERLLEAAAAAPGRPVAELPQLGEAEWAQVTREWNDRVWVADAESLVCLHELFASRAEQRPEAPALARNGRRWSYGELDACANRLANRLRRAGVRAGSRVAVCAEVSPEGAAAVLAVLKAGAACVPLDPRGPRQRLALVLEDSAAELVLAHSHLAAGLLVPEVSRLPASPDLLPLDSLGSAADPYRGESAEEPGAGAGRDDLACLLYLPGPAGGPPLGVMLPHGGVVRASSFRSRAEATLWDLVQELAVGGETLAGEDAAQLRALPEVCGGAWLPAAGAPAPSAVRLAPGTTAHVLEGGGQPAPVGVIGELVVGGGSLAQGYLGRPDLTALRFVPDPFSETSGARLFHTGRPARRTVAGSLEIPGRGTFGQAFAEETGRLGEPAQLSGSLELPRDSQGESGLAAGPGAGPAGEVAAPRTPLEARLVALAAEVLALPAASVGVRHNFFDLGGSLELANRYVELARERCEVAVPLRLLFEAADLGALADLVTEHELESAAGEDLDALLAELELSS